MSPGNCFLKHAKIASVVEMILKTFYFTNILIHNTAVACDVFSNRPCNLWFCLMYLLCVACWRCRVYPWFCPALVKFSLTYFLVIFVRWSCLFPSAASCCAWRTTASRGSTTRSSTARSSPSLPGGLAWPWAASAPRAATSRGWVSLAPSCSHGMAVFQLPNPCGFYQVSLAQQLVRPGRLSSPSLFSGLQGKRVGCPWRFGFLVEARPNPGS